MKLKNINLFITITALVLFGSGCASVTRGTMDALEVNSEPAGAHVEVERKKKPLAKKELKENVLAEESDEFGPLVGKTPAVFTLKRSGDYKVTISKEGYETATVDVTHKIAGAGAAGMAGNALVGGVIGVAVDASSGATLDLVPNPINITLEKIEE
ncbi:MAG: PEGA domain-containing protein [Verrucomicrobiota bacterium]